MSEQPSTGDPRVDAALMHLQRLESLPVHEHVSVLETAHGQVRSALETAPQAGAPHPAPRPTDVPA